MIELTHIAEQLIAEMYNRSRAVQTLFAEQLSKAISLPDETTAIANLQLANCGSFRFDGAHKIDIAILDRTHFVCIPCEAKLGNDRLGKSAFKNRFLTPCLTSHGNSRIKGCMIAILERKLPSQCLNTPVLVRDQGREYEITLPWILITRRNILDVWKKYGEPSVSPACVHILFEEIVRAFGGKGSFNSLVGELINFDYYDTWKV